jgi:hypothetical protein
MIDIKREETTQRIKEDKDFRKNMLINYVSVVDEFKKSRRSLSVSPSLNREELAMEALAMASPQPSPFRTRVPSPSPIHKSAIKTHRPSFDGFAAIETIDDIDVDYLLADENEAGRYMDDDIDVDGGTDADENDDYFDEGIETTPPSLNMSRLSVGSIVATPQTLHASRMSVGSMGTGRRSIGSVNSESTVATAEFATPSSQAYTSPLVTYDHMRSTPNSLPARSPEIHFMNPDMTVQKQTCAVITGSANAVKSDIEKENVVYQSASTDSESRTGVTVSSLSPKQAATSQAASEGGMVGRDLSAMRRDAEIAAEMIPTEAFVDSPMKPVSMPANKSKRALDSSKFNASAMETAPSSKSSLMRSPLRVLQEPNSAIKVTAASAENPRVAGVVGIVPGRVATLKSMYDKSSPRSGSGSGKESQQVSLDRPNEFTPRKETKEARVNLPKSAKRAPSFQGDTTNPRRHTFSGTASLARSSVQSAGPGDNEDGREGRHDSVRQLHAYKRFSYAKTNPLSTPRAVKLPGQRPPSNSLSNSSSSSSLSDITTPVKGRDSPCSASPSPNRFHTPDVFKESASIILENTESTALFETASPVKDGLGTPLPTSQNSVGVSLSKKSASIRGKSVDKASMSSSKSRLSTGKKSVLSRWNPSGPQNNTSFSLNAPVTPKVQESKSALDRSDISMSAAKERESLGDFDSVFKDISDSTSKRRVRSSMETPYAEAGFPTDSESKSCQRRSSSSQKAVLSRWNPNITRNAGDNSKKSVQTALTYPVSPVVIMKSEPISSERLSAESKNSQSALTAPLCDGLEEVQVAVPVGGTNLGIQLLENSEKMGRYGVNASLVVNGFRNIRGSKADNPSEIAGIIVGDVVVGVNGQHAPSTEKLYELVRTARESIVLSILRKKVIMS